MRQFKMPPQIVRLVLLTIGIVVVYFTAKYFLTPPSFGQFGFYRGKALEELAALPRPVFAGRKACEECHADIVETLGKAEHKSISCETCHGISSGHVEDPETKPIKVTDVYCTRCHEADSAKPDWMKQIKAKEHYIGEKCADCHLPHQPYEAP